MNKKLRLLLSILAVSSVMGFAACGTSKEESTNSTSASSVEQSVTGSQEGESVAPEVSEEEESSVPEVTTYTVKFVDADGTTISEIKYEEGAAIVVPADPEKEDADGYSYTFSGWGEVAETATEDVTYTATYTKTAIEYTVTFKAGGVEVGEAQKYTVENKEITVPQVPAKDYYTGAWAAYELTTGDIEVEAVYTPIDYTVTFMNGDETVGEVVYNVESENVQAPAVPEKTGYTGVWGEYSFTAFENQTVSVSYTANKYTLTYNVSGSETGTQEVIFDAEYTLQEAPSAPKSYQEFLGWVDEEGKTFVKGDLWNIASDVTLTANFSNGVVFDTLTSVPTYMTAADTTESLSLVEMNGGKVLEIKSTTNTNATYADRAPALKVTLEFIASFFADENVDYIAFEAKTGSTKTSNFRRVTLRANGTFAADCYEDDMANGKNGAEYVAYNGISADAFKTYYFSRADYEAWVNQGVTAEKFIATGSFGSGDSIYLDNIRPATAEEVNVAAYSLETGNVRHDGINRLIYMGKNNSGQWQVGVLPGGTAFTASGYTNEIASHGIRSYQFTPAANTTTTVRFNTNVVTNMQKAIMDATGYYAFDLYIQEGVTPTLTYTYSNGSYVLPTPISGGWNTLYVKNNTTMVKITDTVGGTYAIDNFRSVTEAEFNATALDFELGMGALRNHELDAINSQGQNAGVAYYYGGEDCKANRFSFAFGEGNTEKDAGALKSISYSTAISHSGNYSLALEKGAGYLYVTMRNDSTAYSLLKDGFTFWIYSTTEINGVDTIYFVNGVNGKFNGGEGINIPANTWTQVTVTTADMNPTRFLILQGNFEGTIYLDDFRPLEK